jgi:hypothetical protein
LKVHWSKKTTTHEDIIAEAKLEDKKLENRDFVRIEISPKDRTKMTRDPKDWKLKVDEEDTLPEWYIEHQKKAEKNCWIAWEQSVQIQLGLNDEDKGILTDTLVFLYDSSSAELYGSSSAELYGSSSAELYDSSSAELNGSSRAELYDSSRAVLYDSSRAVLYDSSRAVLYGSSRAELNGSSSAELNGSSRAVLYGSSRAVLYGSSRAVLYGSSSAELKSKTSVAISNQKIFVSKEATVKIVSEVKAADA